MSQHESRSTFRWRADNGPLLYTVMCLMISYAYSTLSTLPDFDRICHRVINSEIYYVCM